MDNDDVTDDLIDGLEVIARRRGQMINQGDVEMVQLVIKALRRRKAKDYGCICQGNWRAIVKEYAPQIGKTFKRGGKEYRFFGLVHGDDDYYYGLVEIGGKVVLSSCVGSLEMSGWDDSEIRQSTPK